MTDLSYELKAKLIQAKSAEEAAALLKDAGLDEPLVEQLWKEISTRREDQELSLDELETVSGGADRDWVTDGCAATVEFHSWCDSNDNCVCWEVTYEHEPLRECCKFCGTNLYVADSTFLYSIYKCKNCGYTRKDTLF